LGVLVTGGIGVLVVVAFVAAIALGRDSVPGPGDRLAVVHGEGPVGLAVLAARCPDERVKAVEVRVPDGAPLWRIVSDKGTIDRVFVIGAEPPPFFATQTSLQPFPPGELEAEVTIDDIVDRERFDPAAVEDGELLAAPRWCVGSSKHDERACERGPSGPPKAGARSMRGMWRVARARERAVQKLAGAQRRVPWGVALTFDDGPSPDYTPALLDLLRDLDVRATFFVLGAHAEGRPDLVQRMQAEGHGVGSHSRSHPRFATSTRERIDDEIEGGLVDVQLALGRRVRLFRPPHGHIDHRVALAMRSARLDSWLWTIDTEDYVPNQRVEHVVDRCAKVRDRDVLLLHDGMADVPEAVDRSVTLEAVPGIVELVRARGLDFVAL
jgi:peptidoglycan/xylan/chitin deacetylase (PgdA/CDA1 family)